jgi:hypothetical protein
MMHETEKLIGIELTDAQEAMALGGVNRNLDAYETVRKIDIPLDTEPAIVFHPMRAKMVFGPRTKFRFGKVRAAGVQDSRGPRVFDRPQLAELIRTRKITSTELTQMYVSRLKRYGPKLLCVVTLTEELALKQAAAADAGDQTREVSRTAARHSVGRERPLRHQGNQDDLGCRAISRSGYRLRLDRRRTVERAGAVLVAKLSMGALAQGPRWFGGVTRNPWQPEEAQMGSSGSSAGPASATAARIGRFLYRHRDARFDRLTIIALRCHGSCGRPTGA